MQKVGESLKAEMVAGRDITDLKDRLLHLTRRILEEVFDIPADKYLKEQGDFFAAPTS